FITVTVERIGGTEGTVSATFTTANGTATAPADYQAQNAIFTFADGTVGPLTIDIPIIDDLLPEGPETFTVSLSNPTGGVPLGTPSTATVTILDNDTTPTNAFGVDAANNLVRFSTASPGTIVSSTPITGLQAGETILAIDFRPANNTLYGLGSTSRIYAINQA